MPKPFEPGKKYFCRDQLNCDIPFVFVGYYNDKAIFMPEGYRRRHPVLREKDGAVPTDSGTFYTDGRYDIMPYVDRVEKFANVYEHASGTWRESRAECDQTSLYQRLGVIKVVFEDGIPVSVELLKED